MNELVVIEYEQPVTTSLLIAEGVGTKHEHVMKLLNSYKETEILSEVKIRKVSTKGRPANVAILNEVQATFLITLMRNNDVVVNFKSRLVKDFYEMKEKLAMIAANQHNEAWKENREAGKLSRREGTDVIKDFIEYAKAQGSSNAGMYYGNVSKMENKALWLVEGKFKNIRDALSGQQLQVIASADLIAAKAIKRGMDEGMHYKDIFKMAKNDVEAFAALIGKTPVPAGVGFINQKQLEGGNND